MELRRMRLKGRLDRLSGRRIYFARLGRRRLHLPFETTDDGLKVSEPALERRIGRVRPNLLAEGRYGKFKVSDLNPKTFVAQIAMDVIRYFEFEQLFIHGTEDEVRRPDDVALLHLEDRLIEGRDEDD